MVGRRSVSPVATAGRRSNSSKTTVMASWRVIVGLGRLARYPPVMASHWFSFFPAVNPVPGGLRHIPTARRRTGRVLADDRRPAADDFSAVTGWRLALPAPTPRIASRSREQNLSDDARLRVISRTDNVLKYLAAGADGPRNVDGAGGGSAEGDRYELGAAVHGHA